MNIALGEADVSIRMEARKGASRQCVPLFIWTDKSEGHTWGNLALTQENIGTALSLGG